MSARIYQRINGDWGASCDGCQDTGHFIKRYETWNDAERQSRFSVRSVHEPFDWLIRYCYRETAERCIQEDWRRTP